ADLASGRRKLAVKQPLQPFVEGDPQPALRAEPVDGGRAGVAKRRRPALPRATVDLRQRAEGGEVGKTLAFPLAVAVELVARRSGREELFQRTHLELEDAVALDQALLVEVATRARQPLQPLAEPRRTRNVLDPDVQGVSEPPARRIVRA